MKTLRLFSAVLLGSLLLPVLAPAQNYSIDWFTIGGGGGVSTGGVYSVSGTIGQPAAGALSGGAYSLMGGFWAVVAALQNEEGPFLEVSQVLASGSVTVSWPIQGSSSFILEETFSLNTSSGWTLVEPSTYQSNGTDRFITIPGPVTGIRLLPAQEALAQDGGHLGLAQQVPLGPLVPLVGRGSDGPSHPSITVGAPGQGRQGPGLQG